VRKQRNYTIYTVLHVQTCSHFKFPDAMPYAQSCSKMKLSLAILVMYSAVALAAPIISTANKVAVNFYMVAAPALAHHTNPPNPKPPSLTAAACVFATTKILPSTARARAPCTSFARCALMLRRNLSDLSVNLTAQEN
jgi:hypothetical protein